MIRKRVYDESLIIAITKAIERLGGFATLDELLCETQLSKYQLRGAIKYLRMKGILAYGYAFRRFQEVSAISFGSQQIICIHHA
jgi:hypothetical protein